MHSLQLAVKPGNWRLFARRRQDSRFKHLSNKILQRDHRTCQFCTFQADEYQEVINLDGDYYNNQVENLATACCFCTQCFFLESVGVTDFGGGRLIYLPEMTQAALNSFCHVIFCAMINATDYQESAKTFYRNLKFRSRAIEDKFGQDTNKPAIFCQMLIEQKEGIEESSKQALKNIRLLPAYPKFQEQLKTWASAAAKVLQH